EPDVVPPREAQDLDHGGDSERVGDELTEVWERALLVYRPHSRTLEAHERERKLKALAEVTDLEALNISDPRKLHEKQRTVTVRIFGNARTILKAHESK
ncbi:MAG: hypothetical protein M1565_08835, partial [Actinobacteria bacterium]|nr:hypothetical protein [Actinomycetota bacterium]